MCKLLTVISVTICAVVVSLPVGIPDPRSLPTTQFDLPIGVFYAMGLQGTTSCPAGWSEITSASTCQLAAQFTNRTFSHTTASITGCYVNYASDVVWFTNPASIPKSNLVPLCQVPTDWPTEEESYTYRSVCYQLKNRAWIGWMKISSALECFHAAASFYVRVNGKRRILKFAGILESPDRPSGCYALATSSAGVWFNMAPTGALGDNTRVPIGKVPPDTKECSSSSDDDGNQNGLVGAANLFRSSEKTPVPMTAKPSLPPRGKL